MRALVLGAILSGLALPLAAQKPNSFHVFDGSVEYTSRGTLGNQEGELLVRVPGTHFGNLRQAVGISFTMQDQNVATGETYYLIMRKSDGQGGPDITPAGLLYQEGPFPVFGGGSSLITPTHTFKTPVVLPNADFFYGVRVGAPGNGSGSWSTDGAGIHISGMYPLQNGAGNPGPCGEHMRLGVKPGCAWSVSYSGGQPSQALQPFGDTAWLMALQITGPALQAYAIDTIGGAPLTPCSAKANLRDFGYAALWPDLTDLEQYGYKARFGWRVREATYPGAPAVVFIASRMYPNGLSLATPYGRWFLFPNDPYFQIIGGFPVVLSSIGEGQTAPLNPPDTARGALLGTFLYTQALVVDSATLGGALSNWCGISY